MVMVTLFCAIVGKERIVPVDIDDQKSVGHLKKAIANETKHCLDAPDLLTLYKAKENGNVQGAWMRKAHPHYAPLSRGNDVIEATYLTTDTIDAAGAIVTEGTLLDETWSIEDYFADAPRKNVIHVLVVVPPKDMVVPPSYQPQAYVQPSMVLSKWESIDPVSGQPFQVDQKEFTLSDHPSHVVVQTNKLSDFFEEQYGKLPSIYFVREEEKKVWEIMIDRLKRLIPTVIVGSPGVGKSIFLMMLSFYVALVLEQNVLIVRLLKRQKMVYLYLNKQHFSRGEIEDLSDLKFIRPHFADAWLFVDGFTDQQVNDPSKGLMDFRVLATSCQYDNKNDDPAELVVLPAWRLKDLQMYAQVTNWAKDVKLRERLQVKMIPILVRLQYFYSGGSMREFCREHEKCKSRCETNVRRISTEEKCLLITDFGQESTQQVDRIRRHYIEDTSQLEHYQNSKYWQTSVDSGCIMRWLQINRDVVQVYEFYLYAKAVSGGFYGSAFECLFHHTVRQHHQSHTIVLMTSETSDYSRVELEIGNVICSGDGLKDCHEILKTLSDRSYWYPDYPYLPFIDCVCRCRLVDKSGNIEEIFGCIQVTVAKKKLFRRHRMQELEKIKQSNSNLCGYEAIYVVVTPSKVACDSFELFEKDDLSDDDDELPKDAEESMEIVQGEKDDDDELLEDAEELMEIVQGLENMEVEQDGQWQGKTTWKQIITYLDPESVYGRNDDAHFVVRNIEDPSQKKRKQIT